MAERDRMVKTKATEQKVDEALDLLKQIELPLELFTPKRQRRMARVFLAVCDLKPGTPWDQATCCGDGRNYAPTQKGILDYINKHYGEKLSRGSYDDIKRKHLRHLERAGLVTAGANRPGSTPNDSKRGHSLNPEAAPLVRAYGGTAWNHELKSFLEKCGSLRQKYERARAMTLVPVRLPSGGQVQLGPGPHNSLQIAIVEEFLPRFAPGAQVLYLGDADKKLLICDAEKLHRLNFFEISHDTMPDVVAYDEPRNWLFVIEAVHSINPISLERHVKYEEMTKECMAGIVYVSVFKNRKAFAKYAGEISWETEVWIADHPTHMIHYNGPRFLGPYKTPPNQR